MSLIYASEGLGTSDQDSLHRASESRWLAVELERI